MPDVPPLDSCDVLSRLDGAHGFWGGAAGRGALPVTVWGASCERDLLLCCGPWSPGRGPGCQMCPPSDTAPPPHAPIPGCRPVSTAHTLGGVMPPSLTLRSSPVGSQNGPEGAGGTGSRKRPSRAGGGERAPTPPPSAAATGLPGCGCQETPRAPALWVSPRGPGGRPGGGQDVPELCPRGHSALPSGTRRHRYALCR